MEVETGDTSDDNVNVNMFGDSVRGSVERIKNDYGALRCILSKMEFGDLLQARLVCHNWKEESEFFIRRRIKAVDLTTDCRLKEFLKLDRTVYPSIKLDVGGLSTEVLAKCDLEGIQELFIETTGPKRKGRVIKASDVWLGHLENKILNLFQHENNLTSLDLHLTYPITFNREEELRFLSNFANIRSLSFNHGVYYDQLNFEPNGIGSILISRCQTLEYLTMKLGWAHLTFNHLLNMLNERMEQGHAMPILSLQPKIYVEPNNFGLFNQFVDLGPRFEVLKLKIDCGNQQHFTNVIIAIENLLTNTADLLRDLRFKILDVDNISSRHSVTIPSLPRLKNMKIGAKYAPFRFFRFLTDFPCLKKLEFISDWDTFSISGNVFPNLDKLLIGCSDFSYIPDSPPTFPFLREIELCNDDIPVTEEFLRFAFTHLSSVRKMSIVLPHASDRVRYFDAWDIFTGGAQPPPYVLPSPNANDLGMNEVENDAPGQVAGNAVNDEVNVNDGNPVLVEPRPSLQNLTNLRDLSVLCAAPRDIQAITYMTQLKMMEKLDKLVIESYMYEDYIHGGDFDDFPRCLDILQGYHRHVEIQ